MQNYRFPQHKQDKLAKYDVEIFSKYCVDHLMLKLDWANNLLQNASFNGEGCAIFISSTNIMLEQIIGKTSTEIKEILKNYWLMINQSGKYDQNVLGKLIVFENVKSHLNRLHCAEIIYLALMKGKNE